MGGVKTLLITQARIGSTRLPGKILMKINGEELLKIHLQRLSKAVLIDQIVVATTEEHQDKEIVNLCADWGYQTFRGSTSDVLDRFYKVSLEFKPRWIVRVTSDCPLLDSNIIDAVVAFAQVNDLDYTSNMLVENFPDGQDVEVFKFEALEKAWNFSELKSEREHVTPFIRKNSSFNGGDLFTSMNFPSFKNYNKIRMTVDEQADFLMMEQLILAMGTNQNWKTYVDYIQDNQLSALNDQIIRNEGYQKSLDND